MSNDDEEDNCIQVSDDGDDIDEVNDGGIHDEGDEGDDDDDDDECKDGDDTAKERKFVAAELNEFLQRELGNLLFDILPLFISTSY
jgi:hypothetical protein